MKSPTTPSWFSAIWFTGAVSAVLLVFTELPLAEAAEMPELRPVETLREENEFRNRVTVMLREERFDELEDLIETLRDEQPRFASGMSKIRFFYQGVTCRDDRTEQAIWKLFKLQESWRKAKPESVAALISQAETWIDCAWLARGGGYAHTVTPEGWKLFEKRLHNAEGKLELAKKLADQQKVRDPELYRTWLRLALGLGYSKVAVADLLEKSVEVDPTYTPSFARVAVYAMPRWYGQPGDLERLAQEAVDLTKEHVGHEMYAVVVWAIWPFHKQSTFRTFDFSWEKTRRGLRDVLQRHPDSLFVQNQFCLLACLAGDRETAHELFERIGGRYDSGIWQSDANYRKWWKWAQPDHLDGEQQVSYEDHSASVLTVAVSPDGQWLASGGADDFLVLRRLPEDSEPVRLAHDRDVMAAAFSPDGESIATGERSGAVRVWGISSQQATVLGEHDERVNAVAFSPDGRLLASAGYEGQVIIWDVTSGQAKTTLEPAHRRAYGVVFSPDSSQLASVGREGEVRIWDVATGRLAWSAKAHTGFAGGVDWSSDGTMIATSGGDSLAKLWDGRTGKLIATLPKASMPVYAVAFSPDCSKLAGVTNRTSRPGQVLVWDIESKRILKTCAGHKAGIWDVAFSPDGKIIATGSSDVTIRLWDAP